jgi:hypothetical protein
VVTVSKLSTLILTVFDGLPVAPTLVAERGVVLAGQYHEVSELQIFSDPSGKESPFEPLSMKLLVGVWPAKLVVKLSDESKLNTVAETQGIVRLGCYAEDQAPGHGRRYVVNRWELHNDAVVVHREVEHRGGYLLASLPPHASDLLTTRPGNWWCGDFHPTRFAALSATPVKSRFFNRYATFSSRLHA